MARRYGLYVIALIAAGVVARVALAGWLTNDYNLYLLPWYRFARAHGITALGTDFTNYTPFYSYLLLIAVRFDALAAPLVLIKAISLVFEIGNVLLGAALVRVCGGGPGAALVAAGLIWTAPTILYNGPAWAQADSIWTFFILLSVWLFARGRNGAAAFGVAFAVKAQALFLGPFVLGMLLRGDDGRMTWRRAAWLLAVPLVYGLVALPVLIAGRGIGDVATIYGRQAEFFRSLTMNAGSLWALPPRLPYTAGTIAGLGLGVVAALWFARVVAGSPRRDATFALLAAAASLLLMPFVLPKMHDRYFYAFEIAALVLACVNPRYIVFAVVAQVDGVLSYLAFDQGIILGVRMAAIGNAAMLFFILRELALAPAAAIFPRRAWIGYALVTAAGAAFLPFTRHGLTGPAGRGGYAVLLIAEAAAVVALLRASLGSIERGEDRPEPREHLGDLRVGHDQRRR